MPQAKRLIAAALTGDRSMMRKAINEVDYYMKRNFTAYKSHSKKRMFLLNPSPCCT